MRAAAGRATPAGAGRSVSPAVCSGAAGDCTRCRSSDRESRITLICDAGATVTAITMPLRSSRPCTTAMVGWLIETSVRASRSKRTARSASPLRAAGRTLIATSRCRRVSRARYPSPMPPDPIGPAISYAAMREPCTMGTMRPRALYRAGRAVTGATCRPDRGRSALPSGPSRCRRSRRDSRRQSRTRMRRPDRRQMPRS